jgi:hypothetical protein
MEEVQMAIETECANCGVVGQCYNDGEAYICFNREMCKKNQRIGELEARERRLREACKTAIEMDWHGIGAPHVYEQLRAALAPEEEPPA